MGNIFDVIINRFNGGISEDKRSGWSDLTTNKFSITKHFDSLTYPNKLVPYALTKACNGENKALNIVKFLYAPWLSAGAYRLYGLGIASGATNTKLGVYINDIDTADGTWGTPANNEGSTTGRSTEVFFYYKGFIYMFAGGAYLSRFDTTVSAAFNNTYAIIAYETLAEPVHHPSDDCAYFFADNKVYRLNNTSWDGLVLTLPDNMKIVSATPYGNYLAIGCVTKGSVSNKSIVYLWDRDSSISTLTERIDFGEGKMVHLTNLAGRLIAIIDFYLNDSRNIDGGKMLIKQASGQSAVILDEIISDSSSSFIGTDKVVVDDKIFFPARIELNSDPRFGVWVVNSRGKATLDQIEEEATSYEGIFFTGNVLWIAHSGDGSVNRSAYFPDSPFFSTTNASIYESLIFSSGNASSSKKLIGATVTTNPLPAAGQIVLKYRKDEETSWTTIFTHTADNSMSHSAVNIESTGDNLPQYKEIQFRIESTGGAVITGLRFRSETISKDVYG